MPVLLNQAALDDIIMASAIIRDAVQDSAQFNILSVAVHGENLVRDVLNACFDWNLSNLNSSQQNFPGIDLFDRTRGIGVQVSASKTTAKVKDACAKFDSNRTDPRYQPVLSHVSRMVVFTLVRKQGQYAVTPPASVPLVVPDDVWDWGDVQREIANTGRPQKAAATVAAFRAHMPMVFGAGAIPVGQHRRSELQRLVALLDRNAFANPASAEEPVKMYAALDEVRIALQTQGARHVASARSARAFSLIVDALRIGLAKAKQDEPEVERLANDWVAAGKPYAVDYSSAQQFDGQAVVSALMAVRPQIDGQIDEIVDDMRSQ